MLAWVPQTLPHNQPCHFYHIIANLFAYFPSSNRYSIPFHSQVSDSVRLYAARTHRHTHPLNAPVALSPPSSPPTLPEQQLPHSHNNSTTNINNITIGNNNESLCLIDTSSNAGPGSDPGPEPPTMAMLSASASIDFDVDVDVDDRSSLCMTSVGTLDRAMLQLDDDDEEEQGGAGRNDEDDVNDNERLLDDDDDDDDDIGGDADLLLFPPSSSLDQSCTIDSSVGTLNRAMLQLTITSTSVDNSQLSAALPASLLTTSSEQPLPLLMPLPLIQSGHASNSNTDHNIIGENLHMHNSTATSDHSSGSGSSGLFSYESFSCHHDELRLLPSINTLDLGLGREDSDPRRCATDPVAKTLLRLSGKLDDDGRPVGAGYGYGNISGGGGGDDDGFCELDGCLRDRGDGKCEDGEEEEEEVSGEEEDVVRFCCSTDAADDRDDGGEDGENGAGCDDDDEANDLVDDDVERLLNSPTRGLPAVSVPVPPPFLFLPINAAATATDTVHGNNA